MDHRHEVKLVKVKLLDNLKAGITMVKDRIASPQAGAETVRNRIASPQAGIEALRNRRQIVYQQQIIYQELLGLQMRMSTINHDYF